MIESIYIIGSLRNPEVPQIGKKLRRLGFDVFDSWYSAGERADDSWQAHETLKGNSYAQALKGYAAQNVFNFDKKHLQRCDAAVLVLPAGKSGHMELGFMIGSGKKGFVLFDQAPARWDVMYGFASETFFSQREFFKYLRKLKENN